MYQGYFFIPFMRFSWQVYWGGLPFPPSVDHNLSELSAMTRPSWVALHSMAHSFIELHKPLHHDKTVIHINKVSGYNEIPAELFTSLKEEAIKVLHSLSQQFWKTQQWPQDWKMSVLIQSPRKVVPKNCTHLSMLVRSCLKSWMLGFSIMQTKSFQMSKLGLEKEEELEIKLPTLAGL